MHEILYRAKAINRGYGYYSTAKERENNGR